MNRIFLALVMSLSGIWRGMGADIEQLKVILSVKLKMDDRKPLSFGRRKEGKKHRFTSAISMLLYAFTGLIYIFPLFAFKDTIFAMWAYFLVFLFLLTFSLITDFSNIIIDSADKFILVPRPVNDRTIFLSRNLYIFIYMLRMVLPMSLPGWIVLGLSQGWVAAVFFPLPILLMTFMALFLVNAVYLFILRISKPERFKDIIGYFQVAFSVFIIAFYYLMQGVTRSATFQNLDIRDYGWIRFTPPYWLAACWNWLGYEAALPGTKWLSILAIVFPLLALWATLKWLAPSFGRKIAAIDGVEVIETQPGKPAAKQKSRFSNMLANVLVKSDAGKAGFLITWLQSARSRSFKMKVYPAFAYVPVYFFYLLLNSDEPFSQVWAELPERKIYLLLLYMTAFAMMQALNYVNISDQYKAAWIYYSAPVQTPGHVLTGAFKALWIKYFLPFMLVIGGFVIYVWGSEVLLDVILATLNVTVFAVGVMRTTHKSFPFSMKEQMKQTGMKGIFRGLLTFLLVFVLGICHYLVSVFWWLKLIFIILTSIFLWLVWDSCRNIGWKAIAQGDE